MKRLLGLLLVMGMVGCGGPLEKLGAKIKRNDQGHWPSGEGSQEPERKGPATTLR